MGNLVSNPGSYIEQLIISILTNTQTLTQTHRHTHRHMHTKQLYFKAQYYTDYIVYRLHVVTN